MEPVWTGHYSAKILKAARDSNRRSLLLEATTRPTCSMSWAWSYKRKCSAYIYAMLVWSTVIGWKILNGQSERSKLADRQFTWKFFFIGLSPGNRQTNNHWKWIIFKIKKNILENSFFVCCSLPEVATQSWSIYSPKLLLSLKLGGVGNFDVAVLELGAFEPFRTYGVLTLRLRPEQQWTWSYKQNLSINLCYAHFRALSLVKILEQPIRMLKNECSINLS